MSEEMRSQELADLVVQSGWFRVPPEGPMTLGRFMMTATTEVLVLCFVVVWLALKWRPRTEALKWLAATVETHEILAVPTPRTDLFLKIEGPVVFARYKWSGTWRVAKVRSVDPNDTVTVVWEDGFLQIGTRPIDVRRLSKKAQRAVDALSTTPAPVLAPVVPTGDASSVWELAKRGHVDAVLKIIDQGDASPNDLEQIDGQAGRSVLYHACHSGNVHLVAGLLKRGAFDWDHTCDLAITGNERADETMDLLFDPDTSTFSDFIDYNTNSPGVVVPRTFSSADRIRTMLRRAAKHAPPAVFRSAVDDCCVCTTHKADAVSVCGHVACCRTCLATLRDRRDGCPICRCRIRDIFAAPAT